MLRLSSSSLLLAFATAIQASAQSATASQAGAVKASEIVARIPLPGGASWDHITTSIDARRLYLAHESHVDVLDLDGDTLVAVIANAKGAHGVALATELGKGFTSNGEDSSLTVFDLRSNTIAGRVKLRADAPDGIAYDPSSQRVFAMHSAKPSLTVIDARTNALLKTVALGDTPDGAVSDRKGKLFVALKPTSQLAVVNTATLVVEHHWHIAPCERPDAIALDDARQQIVLGCNNRLAVVVRADNGAVLSTFPIGLEVDGISLDDAGNAIVSCGDGTLHFAQRRGARFTVTRIVATPKGAPNSALDRRRHRVYVPTGSLGTADKPAFGLIVVNASPISR